MQASLRRAERRTEDVRGVLRGRLITIVQPRRKRRSPISRRNMSNGKFQGRLPDDAERPLRCVGGNSAAYGNRLAMNSCRHSRRNTQAKSSSRKVGRALGHRGLACRWRAIQSGQLIQVLTFEQRASLLMDLPR